VDEETPDMNELLKVGVIGDYDPNLRSHIPTKEALGHAAEALSISVDSSWLPTQSLANGFVESTLQKFDALWCAPGSPYKSMDGALRGIQFAREKRWPFIGT
jgi:CTP synthase (UTP-ammonia lyase)